MPLNAMNFCHIDSLHDNKLSRLINILGMLHLVQLEPKSDEGFHYRW